MTDCTRVINWRKGAESCYDCQPDAVNVKLTKLIVEESSLTNTASGVLTSQVTKEQINMSNTCFTFQMMSNV